MNYFGKIFFYSTSAILFCSPLFSIDTEKPQYPSFLDDAYCDAPTENNLNEYDFDNNQDTQNIDQDCSNFEADHDDDDATDNDLTIDTNLIVKETSKLHDTFIGTPENPANVVVYEKIHSHNLKTENISLQENVIGSDNPFGPVKHIEFASNTGAIVIKLCKCQQTWGPAQQGPEQTPITEQEVQAIPSKEQIAGGENAKHHGHTFPYADLSVIATFPAVIEGNTVLLNYGTEISSHRLMKILHHQQEHPYHPSHLELHYIPILGVSSNPIWPPFVNYPDEALAAVTFNIKTDELRIAIANPADSWQYAHSQGQMLTRNPSVVVSPMPTLFEIKGIVKTVAPIENFFHELMDHHH